MSADALQILLTGAGSDGARQSDPAASLGGFRSRVRAQSIETQFSDIIQGIQIDYVSGANGAGIGTLVAPDADSLAWRPPGATQGTRVTIANGEQIEIPGDDADKYIIVQRVSSDDLQGSMAVQCLDVMYNAMGMGEFTDSEQTSGHAKYRALAMYNAGSTDITNLSVQASLLQDEVSITSHLGASGSGTIGGDFTDWREFGYVEIETSGGSQREIVYYESRTDSALTVAASGRGQLGTSAAAGAAGDVAHAISPVRFATESPSSDQIQTVADEDTAPTGVTWKAGRDALSIGTVSADTWEGLWLELNCIAGHEASAALDVRIDVSFDYDGTSYSAQLRGVYRVEDGSIEVHMLWVSQDTAPDVTGDPDETWSGSEESDGTWTGLPNTTSALLTAPGSGTRLYKVRYGVRNAYGLQTLDPEVYEIRIDSSANQDPDPPLPPELVQLTAQSNGDVLVEAQYMPNRESVDSNRADAWFVYATDDGTDPDPSSDTPTEVAITTGQSQMIPVSLSHTVSVGALEGAPIRVIVHTARDESGVDIESENDTVYEVEAEWFGPERVFGAITQDRSWGYAQDEAVDTPANVDTTIDATNNVFWRQKGDELQLWADTVLVLNFVCLDRDTYELRTTYGWKATEISGAASESAATEIGTWDAGAKEIFVNVRDTHRLKADVVAETIEYAALDRTKSVVSTLSQDPAWRHWLGTVFNIFNQYEGDYKNVASLDTEGIMAGAKIAWRRCATEADCQL